MTIFNYISKFNYESYSMTQQWKLYSYPPMRWIVSRLIVSRPSVRKKPQCPTHIFQLIRHIFHFLSGWKLKWFTSHGVISGEFHEKLSVHYTIQKCVVEHLKVYQFISKFKYKTDTNWNSLANHGWGSRSILTNQKEKLTSQNDYFDTFSYKGNVLQLF